MNLLEHTESDCRSCAWGSITREFGDRFIVRSEYKIRRLDPASRGARLDLALLDPATGKILLIIEVKRRADSKSYRQGRRYADLTGAPVIYLKGMAECELAAAHVAEALNLELSSGVESLKTKVIQPPPLDPEDISRRIIARSERLRVHRDKLSGG